MTTKQKKIRKAIFHKAWSFCRKCAQTHLCSVGEIDFGMCLKWAYESTKALFKKMLKSGYQRLLVNSCSRQSENVPMAIACHTIKNDGSKYIEEVKDARVFNIYANNGKTQKPIHTRVLEKWDDEDFYTCLAIACYYMERTTTNENQYVISYRFN